MIIREERTYSSDDHLRAIEGKLTLKCKRQIAHKLGDKFVNIDIDMGYAMEQRESNDYSAKLLKMFLCQDVVGDTNH